MCLAQNGGKKMFKRASVDKIASRMNEATPHIQIVNGPRQCGKTTALKQALEEIDLPNIYVSADQFINNGEEWLKAQWQAARNLCDTKNIQTVLVVDEIQSIKQWSSIVKSLYDEDRWVNRKLKVVLSGSSSLLLQKGLTESLMGRFELLPQTQWTYEECRDAFDYSLEDYLYFGGYPGAAMFKDDKERWINYMQYSVIMPSISKDIISLEDVRKPHLMEKLFMLGCAYSSQELSYRKILGQLDEAGNMTTVAHYLGFLDNANLLCGLMKFDTKPIRSKSSSPRFCAYDPSFLTVANTQLSNVFVSESEKLGRITESTVGSHLLKRSRLENFNVYWWRDGNDEVDFVVQKGEKVSAIEVKSGRVKGLKGMQKFLNLYPFAKSIVVGSDYAGCSLEKFLSKDFELF